MRRHGYRAAKNNKSPYFIGVLVEEQPQRLITMIPMLMWVLMLLTIAATIADFALGGTQRLGPTTMEGLRGRPRNAALKVAESGIQLTSGGNLIADAIRALEDKP